MATLNFPDNPSTGDEYYDSNAGFNYEWNGTVWITKDLATPDNIREIDDISSGFDGSDTTFTLQVNGVNIVPKDVKQLVISVGGVMQNPGDDYTVSGSTLTFTSAPSSGLSFTGTFLGAAASQNTITAGSVSPSSLTTTSNYTVGSIKVSGASTIGNFVLTGLTTIADPDVTNFNSSGVGTVSNVIITGDNSGLGATIGAAVGVVTYYGDASNMTGVGLTFFPLVYGPGIGSTDQLTNTDVTTTWNFPIQAGSGTITIRTGSGSGTIVDQFVVGSSSSITISGRTLTLNPAADLAADTEHFVVYPAGAIKSSSGQKENKRLVTSFTTKPQQKNLYSWGRSTDGVPGRNQPAPTQVSSPVQVDSDGGWTRLYTTYTNVYTAAGAKTAGSLWTWGDNQLGALGINIGGYTGDRSSPTQLTGTTSANHARGMYHGISSKTDGTLWTWGYNDSGHLGHNNRVDYSSPTQVGTDTDWGTGRENVGSGQRQCFVIKQNGTLWSWGTNIEGALGLNQSAGTTTGTSTNVSSPTQVGTDTTWAWVTNASANRGVGSIKTDGTLWMWGDNEWGELGLNSRGDSRSSPTQVPGTTWAKLFGGDQVMAGVKTDGTLWTWGYNAYGQLGHNTHGSPGDNGISSPTQVPGTTWSRVAIGSYNMLATKTDGTYWTWGWSYQGALGQNNVAKYSSPVQLPGTWSEEIGGANMNAMGIKLE